MSSFRTGQQDHFPQQASSGYHEQTPGDESVEVVSLDPAIDRRRLGTALRLRFLTVTRNVLEVEGGRALEDIAVDNELLQPGARSLC